jgi:hypothetical protein
LNRAAVAFRQVPAYYQSYNESKVNKVYGAYPKFERPKILMIEGKPKYLFAPSGWNITGGKRVVCNILKISD